MSREGVTNHLGEEMFHIHGGRVYNLLSYFIEGKKLLLALVLSELYFFLAVLMLKTQPAKIREL